MSRSSTSSKKTYVMSVSTKVSESKTETYFLKSRVEELEAEVISLKKRLDDLRKAKNTTIQSKQKGHVTTGRRAGSDTKLKDLQHEMAKLAVKHEHEMDALRRRHDDSLKTLHKESQSCSHEEEISDLTSSCRQLRVDNEELGSLNDELRRENDSLRDKFEELFAELSIKEARWCEKEDLLNLKMKLQWDERYREWMEVTEKKIADLQEANKLLGSCLKPEDVS